jgi:uncharacterized protein YjbJ (UPF0337 family)
MSNEKRVEATIKNIEGKLQEGIGEITGNPSDRAEGKAKQVESQVIHTTENIKDELKKAID